MKRWDSDLRDYTENKEIDSFLNEIIEVCKKHKMSISHEDGHGAFEVKKYNDHCTEWLKAAHVARGFDPGIV